MIFFFRNLPTSYQRSICLKPLVMHTSNPTSEELSDETEVTDNNPVPSSGSSSLRHKAEEILEEKEPLPLSIKFRNIQRPINLADTDTTKLIYELEVHQIELEMQNEELQKAKVQSQKSAEKYTELYDFSPSGYFTLTRDGDILDLNLFGSQLLGKERAYLKNSRFGFFVADDSKPEFSRFIETLFTTKCKASCEITLDQKNSDLPVNLFLTGIVTENSEQCLISAIDITHRKQIEEEIKNKNTELKRVNADKDKFFSIIAHDLRGPFNGFLGLTELLAEGLSGMTSDEIRKIALMMKNSATNVNHLLGNLLEWSQMERGLIPFTPKAYFLIPGLKESLVLVLEAAKTKHIVIDFDIPENLIVYADKNMLDSVFRNLVFNAVKFTPRGGSITVSAKSLTDDTVEFSVKDTGIGMNDTLIDHLFSMDAKTGRKGTENELSTGLGLIICKDLIEKHSGKLTIKSKEGKGSTFCFTIPDKR